MSTKAIIVNLAGFIVVGLISTWLIIINAFGINQARLPFRYWLDPRNLLTAITYRQTYPACQDSDTRVALDYVGSPDFLPIAPGADGQTWYLARYESDGWTIYLDTPQGISPLIHNISYPSADFVTGLRPVTDTLVYPECRADGCFFTLFNLQDHTTNQLPAVLGDSPNAPSKMTQVSFDPQARLIIYATPQPGLSSRLVINYFGELIHAIDEQPGTSTRLTLLGYHAQSPWLIYQDDQDWTYFYHAQHVALVRRHCP